MTTANKFPSKEYLNKCFAYDGCSLIWKSRPSSHFDNKRGMIIFNSQRSGNVAGTIDNTDAKNKYIKVCLDG